MLKKVLAVLAIVAMVAFAAPAPAMADSWSYTSGDIYGGCGVYGVGNAYTYGDLWGEGGSATESGGTWTDMSASLWGSVSAHNGASYVDGGTGGWTGAYEGSGYTYSYSSCYSSVYAQTYGNSSALVNASIGMYADAWNY